MSLQDLIPGSWRSALSDEFTKPYWEALEAALEKEYKEQKVYPARDDIFNAFGACAYADVKVLLLGQDPYHGAGQAHGLSFSVRPGVKIPPSLLNMYKELEDDLGFPRPKKSGTLTPWAVQGVMLLNAALTVREADPGSHKDLGWEKFSDAVIRKLDARTEPLVFILWGGFAKNKLKLIDDSRHIVITGAHPSPLSAKNGFFGSKPFSKVNAALKAYGKSPIDWQIRD